MGLLNDIKCFKTESILVEKWRVNDQKWYFFTFSSGLDAIFTNPGIFFKIREVSDVGQSF